jgi:sec-independent protein translocase protein TatB
MFDIGWAEMMVIAVVAIVVVGPKELPGMLRTFGKTMGKVRRMSRDFQRQFDDALKEADLDDVRKGIETVKKANPTHALKQAMAPVTHEMTEVANTASKPVAAKTPISPIPTEDAAPTSVAPASTTKPEAPEQAA